MSEASGSVPVRRLELTPYLLIAPIGLLLLASLPVLASLLARGYGAG